MSFSFKDFAKITSFLGISIASSYLGIYHLTLNFLGEY